MSFANAAISIGGRHYISLNFLSFRYRIVDLPAKLEVHWRSKFLWLYIIPSHEATHCHHETENGFLPSIELKTGYVLVGIERWFCDLVQCDQRSSPMYFRIPGYMSGQERTMYPICPDETIDLSIPQFIPRQLEYPKMIDSKSEIVFSTTTIALHTSTELIQMNIALHIIQISSQPTGMIGKYLRYPNHLNSMASQSEQDSP